MINTSKITSTITPPNNNIADHNSFLKWEKSSGKHLQLAIRRLIFHYYTNYRNGPAKFMKYCSITPP
jgi:hypothetical protein